MALLFVYLCTSNFLSILVHSLQNILIIIILRLHQIQASPFSIHIGRKRKVKWQDEPKPKKIDQKQYLNLKLTWMNKNRIFCSFLFFEIFKITKKGIMRCPLYQYKIEFQCNEILGQWQCKLKKNFTPLSEYMNTF